MPDTRPDVLRWLLPGLLCLAAVAAGAAATRGFAYAAATGGVLLIGCVLFSVRLDVAELAAVAMVTYTGVASLGPVRNIGAAVSLVIAPLALLLVFWHRGRAPFASPNPFMNLSNALLLLAALASVFVSLDPYGSLIWWAYGIVVPTALFHTLTALRPSTRVREWLLFGFILSTAVTLGLGLVAFYRGFGIPGSLDQLFFARYQPQIKAYQEMTWGHVLHTGDLLLLVIPPTALLLWRGGGWKRVAAGAALAIQLASLVVIGTRSAPIILVSVAGLLAVMNRRRLRTALVVVAVILAVVYMAPRINPSDPVVQHFQGILQEDDSTSGRLEAMSLGLHMFLAHPIVGVGAGTFYLHEAVYTAAHSLPINLAAEIGVGGLGSYLLLLVALGSVTVKIWRDPHRDPLIVGCFLGAMAFTLQCIFIGSNLTVVSSNVWSIGYYMYLALLFNAYSPQPGSVSEGIL